MTSIFFFFLLMSEIFRQFFKPLFFFKLESFHNYKFFFVFLCEFYEIQLLLVHSFKSFFFFYEKEKKSRNLKRKVLFYFMIFLRSNVLFLFHSKTRKQTDLTGKTNLKTSINSHIMWKKTPACLVRCRSTGRLFRHVYFIIKQKTTFKMLFT